MARRKTRHDPKPPKLSGNSSHFPALIENAPVAIGISRNGVTSYGNKMYLKLFGFQNADEIRGQSILDYWAPKSRAEITKRIRQRALGLPVPTEYEAIAQRKDGSQFPVQVAVTVTELEDGPATAAFFWDLSDRKKAEESLRESEERFRKVFEVGPLAMVINGMDNRYLDANPAFCKLVGYSKEELANLTFLDLTHPDDLERDLGMTDRVYAGEIPNFRFEKRYIRKDGKVVWVDLAGTVIRDREDKILYGLAMVEDITEWKRAEEALRLRERDLEEAQRLAQVGSWVWDVRSATVTWSKGMYHVTGRDPKLPSPRSTEEFQTLFPAETWARLDAAGLETLRTGVPFEMEAEIITPGGSRKWVISRAEAERDADGTPIRLRGTVQDISERKRSEKLLQASEERYRLLFERNLAGVIRTDMDGRVLECNDAFAKIHGYASREEVMAVNAREFYFDISSREAFLRQLERDKIVVGYESHARRKDGNAAWVLLSSSLIEGGPEGPTIQSTTFDITRWRELGEHLRQAQKMDAVGRLAGGVAHDFNNMLQIINGYSELLLDGIPEGDPLREYVEEIKNSVDRSAGLTRQLLAFSRQQVLAPQILDFNKVIANSTRMVRRLIGDDIKLR